MQEGIVQTVTTVTVHGLVQLPPLLWKNPIKAQTVKRHRTPNSEPRLHCMFEGDPVVIAGGKMTNSFPFLNFLLNIHVPPYLQGQLTPSVRCVGGFKCDNRRRGPSQLGEFVMGRVELHAL